MGKKDLDQYAYFDDELYFADVCNGILFQGDRRILPEELEESDTQLVYPDKKMALAVRVDSMRYWRKQGINLALIGIEHQSATDYHMVFRNMMAESLAYYKQWKQNKRRYSKEYKEWFGRMFRLRNSKEFLSGMQKEDKFIPVIILVINWSKEKWDGAITLHEMLKLPNELVRYVNNYKLNIFDCHNCEDLSVFKTEVRVLFEALKTSGEEDKMVEVFQRFPRVESDTARFIETILNVKFEDRYLVKDEMGKEWMEVCKAWDDHFKSGEREGIAIGRKMGIEQGIEQTFLLLVSKKIRKNMTLDMIADDLEEDVEVIRPIYEKAKAQMK